MSPSYPGRILIVDDDQDTRDIYGEFLTEAGFEVDYAKDGNEGLAKILEGGYDLVLLDIMMPKIDGITILKKLKENPPQGYNGPIVMLSALDQEHIVKSALDLGAAGFLSKTNVNPEEALNKVSEFMRASSPQANK